MLILMYYEGIISIIWVGEHQRGELAGDLVENVFIRAVADITWRSEEWLRDRGAEGNSKGEKDIR